MGTSTARELTCDRPASYPGGVMYSHPLALRKPGISTGLMSLKAREGFNFNFTVKCHQSIQDHTDSGKINTSHIPFQTSKYPTMPSFTIGTEGICKLLKALQQNKAAGPDKISPTLLRELRDQISGILQIIFTKSLETDKVPSCWLDANISPIYKKGDRSLPSNYRPASLNCVICKVMEHIIISLLVKHFNNHNILYELQHGFTEKRSCETQLSMFIYELLQNMQKGKQTDLILLGFSKAFDKVSHEQLIYKLHNKHNTLS